MSLEEYRKQYQQRIPVLEKVAQEIETRLIDLLKEEQIKTDRIQVRVKTLDSFLGKIKRKNYEHPLSDIQDQIGSRIVVLFKSEVEVVKDLVLQHFTQIEMLKKENEPNVFDYQAYHLICHIPTDIKISFNSPINFFEIQISTIFQYAWSQANHDLGYKTNDSPLSNENKRRLALAAAQAWGADEMFNEVKNNSKMN